MVKQGSFVISLDFELFWGVSDSRSIESYGNNIRNVHSAVPRLLDLFAEFDVHATWATVGFVMAKNLEELKSFLPEQRPSYKNAKVSNYRLLDSRLLQENPEYFFAEDLVQKILQHQGQELASHSLSHYYCQEEGQTLEQFTEDIQSAIQISEKFNVQPRSFVFPRNQFNESYLKALSDLGIRSFRGNQSSYAYSPVRHRGVEKRILRLADRYLPVLGNHTFEVSSSEKPMNIPASAFLAPSEKPSPLNTLRLSRIKNMMESASRNNKVMHLWWHPHNLGANTEYNFQFLREILGHYKKLHQENGFRSQTMAELSDAL